MASDRLQSSTLHRALRSLAHPLTITSILILLVNDHVLRVLWPSWITGKLGDAAWLAFAPLMLALPLALIFPRRDRLVIGLSIGITGFVFAAMKTSPAAMQFGLSMLEGIVGYPVTLRVDPTDLLALPAMALSLWAWQRDVQPATSTRGWVVLSLAALASIANSPSPSMSADCIIIRETGEIVATTSGYWVFDTISTDGGVTWSETRTYEPDDKRLPLCTKTRAEQQWLVADPHDPNIVYRMTHGASIERSTDGGRTWSLEKDLSFSEALIEYYKNVKNLWSFHTGPLDAVIDPESGNLIVAMGFEGTLTRTPDGKWHNNNINASSPGEGRVTLFDPRALLELIWLELVFGGLAALLNVGTIGLLTNRNNPSTFFRWLAAPVAWGLWLVPMSYHPATVFYTFGAGLFLLYGFPAIILFEGVWALLAYREIRHQYRGIPPEIVKGALATFAGFSLPFIFWGWNLIPAYNLAITVSMSMLVIILLYTGWTVRKKYLS